MAAAAKKKVKKVEADSAPRKAEAFKLNEELQEYFLSWALDGEFYPDAMNEAAAAFGLSDVEKLRELCAEYRTELNFIEAPEALEAHLPRMKPIKLKDGSKRDFTMDDYSPSDRASILARIPGTRAYARVQIEARGMETPFG